MQKNVHGKALADKNSQMFKRIERIINNVLKGVCFHYVEAELAQ